MLRDELVDCDSGARVLQYPQQQRRTKTDVVSVQCLTLMDKKSMELRWTLVEGYWS